MSLIAKNAGGDFELPEEGPTPAICDAVIDMGFQETKFGTKLKLYIRFQLPEHKMDDGRPMVIGGMYTNSLNEKAKLRTEILAGLGIKLNKKQEVEGYDLSQLIGKTCLLNVVHNDAGERTYANIGGLMALPKGTKAPTLDGDPIVFDMENQGDLDRLPRWIQERIGTPIEAKQDGDKPFNDDIPF